MFLRHELPCYQPPPPRRLLMPHVPPLMHLITSLFDIIVTLADVIKSKPSLRLTLDY